MYQDVCKIESHDSTQDRYDREIEVVMSRKNSCEYRNRVILEKKKIEDAKRIYAKNEIGRLKRKRDEKFGLIMLVCLLALAVLAVIVICKHMVDVMFAGGCSSVACIAIPTVIGSIGVFVEYKCVMFISSLILLPSRKH